MSAILNLSKDQHVDIHLINGVLARGVVTATNEKIVVLEHQPALHSQHGTKAFEKIMIDRSYLVVIGFTKT